MVRAPAKHYLVALEPCKALVWTQESWWRMKHERPLMAAEIVDAVMRQFGEDSAWSQEGQSLNRNRGRTRVAGGQGEQQGQNQFFHDALHATHSDPFQSLNPDDNGAAPKASETSVEQMQCSTWQTSTDKSPCNSERMSAVTQLLRHKLRDLEFSHCLDLTGLYDLSGDTNTPALPDLPPSFSEDLIYAFEIHNQRVQGSKPPLLPFRRVPRALKTAGLFGFPEEVLRQFLPGPSHEPPAMKPKHAGGLTVEEFLLCGRAAAMAPLNQKQLDSLRGTFDELDLDKDGLIKRKELNNLLSSSSGRCWTTT